MRRSVKLALLTILVISAGCNDMHDQVSIQPQEAPRLTMPEQAIPASGRERVTFGQQLTNPMEATATSRQKGTALYLINCSLCHGSEEQHPGSVGARLNPPPPDLHDGHLSQYDESTIYQLITLGVGRMPAFGPRLSSTDRWHLVNYLHGPAK